MEADFVALLLADQGLAELVGDYIQWNEIPQGTVGPTIVMFRVDGVPTMTMRGPDGLEASRVQVDIRAETYASAIAVRNAVKALLSGFRGKHGSTFFQGILLVLDRAGFETSGATSHMHRITTDWTVWHRPAA